MARKKLYSFKFKPDMVNHLKNEAKQREMSLTEYIERGMKKVSKYKEPELV